MVHKIYRCGKKPGPRNLYFALLLFAEKRGTLQHEAEMLRVTPQLAESQLRRFRLWTARDQRKVAMIMDNWITPMQIQEARKIASEYRFSLPSVTGKA